MSRRKKNAGEGFQMMFHGSFAKKADAVAKEKKTPGAFVKGTLTNLGYRYLVMSPRKNPIRRRKHNPDAVLKKAIAAYHKLGKLEAEGKSERAWKIRMALARFNKRLGISMAQLAEHARGSYSSPNPHELLVMGANPSHVDPHTQEISLPPGATILIRTPRQNPVNPDRYSSAQARASGASYHAPGLIRTKKQKRIAGMVRTRRKHKYDWIMDLPSGGIAPGQNPGDDPWMYQALAELFPGKTLGQLSMQELSKVAQLAAQLKHSPRQNIELGTYEDGVFHPWTRRPASRQKKAIRRQNTTAATLREEFTGAPAEYYTVRNEPHMPAGDYAELGKLLELYVKPIRGEQVQQITFHEPLPIVVSDESARQIWFVDGDQDLTNSLAIFGALDRGAGVYELGDARRIDYRQRKEHVPDPDTDEWRHSFGEENKIFPRLLFDASKKRILLEGGDYEIRREGITN